MSAFRPEPESTGLVPDRSFAPVPSAVNVKSATVAVPPLSFTTTFRKCSFGAMSSLVIVHVTSWPVATVIALPSCEPPSHTQAEEE